MVMFDVLFPLKKIINKTDRNYRTSYQWFESIQEHSKPLERSSDRNGDHFFENRLSIDKLNHKQIHATLHALEIECREKSPAFGVQLEYYYSLYIFFFMSALYALLILTSDIYHFIFLDKQYISDFAMYLDITIVAVCLIGTYFVHEK